MSGSIFNSLKFRISWTSFNQYYFLYFRYKGRIIYNTRYQENNAGQQVVAGGNVSGSASQASASTSSSGATAINGCSAVAGGDSVPLSLSRETRRSTRYSRNGAAVNGSALGYTGETSGHHCNQRSSSSHHHERNHHRNNYSSVGSSACNTRSGRSNNSYSSGRNSHSHGGKSARSRRYAAGEGERYERGTHPYSIPSTGSVSSASSSVHSSKHQFVDESSSVDR